MNPEEHEYFHTLMWHLGRKFEPKFDKGCIEYKGKAKLWDMSDEDLDKNMQEEMTDYMMYYGEKLRREYAGKKAVPTSGVGAGIGFL